jgi:hypothetical protein
VNGGLLIADCSAPERGGRWWSPSGTLEPVDLSEVCGSSTDPHQVVVGASSSPGRFVTATLGGGLRLSSWSFDGAAVQAGPTEALRPEFSDAGRVGYAEEISDGEFVAVVHDPARGRWEVASAAPTLSIPDDAPASASHAPVVRRGADGALWLAPVAIDRSAARLIRLGIDATEIGAIEVDSDLPDLDANWFGFGAVAGISHDRDQDDARLASPADARVWTPTDAGFTAADVPSTPCADRAACRRVGESYLLASAAYPGGRMLFYGLWDWYGYGGLYAVPVAE